MEEIILKELLVIPGIGKSIAQDLFDLGIRKVSDLKGKDPEKLYKDFCYLQGQQIDRCLLYVFRGAVYFASHKTHDPEKLKWWNWKDQNGGR
ncbi:MAG: helix-hairpin-helix domain-containing protein [Candidatus Doudnabacteria bacterium]